MRLFSYIIVHDSGFAPNPFWGYCTLACCKPSIRRTADVSDWIVGISPRSRGNRVIYAMEITESPLTYEQYALDRRFGKKIPQIKNREIRRRCGDNIYRPLGFGRFEQLPNPSHGRSEMLHDLGGENVLVSDHFFYFGSAGVELPDHLRILIGGRGHKCRFSETTIHEFLEFIHRHQPGIHAPPTKWPNYDSSWREPGTVS